MRYIDLSYKIINDMPVYPGDRGVQLFREKELAKDYYNAYALFTGLHAGTHIDCPMHLLNSEKTILDYGIDKFAGQGVLIDARGDKEIGYKEEYAEKINKNDIVLIYTGFQKMYGTDEYYNMHPVLTKELAEFFVNKEIKLIGMDMPSPDFPPFEIHKLLLSNEIFILENLTNLHELLPIDSFEVFAEPLKLKAEASPVRAFARY